MTRSFSREPIRHQGNQSLFRALELSILATAIGLPLHVHSEGLRGTGKTTIIRSLRARLPRIERIRGCVYNCLPTGPHCPLHRHLDPSEVAGLGREWVPMPFREISHSAKIGTVAGSIDLGRLADTEHPEAALLPGTIPQAHRGIIFVDEINRLADTAPELADLLLDVMGTKPGRLQVEETGLAGVDLPAAVSVWAASNPDEDPGPLEDIRKQLSDRFDFVISMERPSTVNTVKEILRSSRERLLGHLTAAGSDARLAATVVPAEAYGQADLGDGPPGDDWLGLGAAVGRVLLPATVEELIASLYVDFGLESLRGIEAIHLGARLNCVLDGRDRIGIDDVLAVAPGALQHRLDVSTFARVMDYLAEKAEADSAEVGAAGECGEEADSRPAEVGVGAAGEAAVSGGSPGAAGGRERAAAEGGESAANPDRSGDAGRGTGWSLWRSLFGTQRERSQEASAELTPGRVDGAAADAGATLPPGSSGARASGEPGSASATGGPPQAAPPEDPVAPPHQARPLADILREMETAGGIPPWPRPR